MDYFPFGNIRLDQKAGSFDEQRKFIGEEYDVDTGLNYLNARYYNASIGRFASQDPMFWVLPSRYLQDPQEQNSYAYARNNPVVNSDPTGQLNLIIPGTSYDPNSWSKDSDAKALHNNVNTTFASGRYTVIMNMKSVWSGANNDAARQEAANNIASIINGHNFKDGETLNIVAHSHGGNVAALISQKVNHKIDNLVTLETPVRSDYQPNYDMIGRHINTYSYLDPIQSMGGDAGYKILGSAILGTPGKFLGGLVKGPEFGPAGRKFSGAENVNVTWQASKNPFVTHSTWQSDKVWSKIDSLFSNSK